MSQTAKPKADGLLLVNKPVGITSFDVIRRLRVSTGIRKIGHAGTLDPFASGLMLMLFGTACKQAESFAKLDKVYRATLRLGMTSSTGDKEGTMTTVNSRVPAESEVRDALRYFVGEIRQTPSVYSAIKIQGKEAYKRARAGEDVVMPSRLVNIRRIELLSYDYPNVTIVAEVSSGTYIRSLAEDVGKRLGTGAYLDTLVRTVSGTYELSNAVELDDVDHTSLSGFLRQV
ncbi:MAG TPA: tRNA pseudouridine(55) synthase TruB [Candidatus Saccharimonadia bacterium]|nr:tRNA pseudouridine(55) synthase TruB [Candidatus Saccharimonadia bacterium]